MQQNHFCAGRKISTSSLETRSRESDTVHNDACTPGSANCHTKEWCDALETSLANASHPKRALEKSWPANQTRGNG